MTTTLELENQLNLIVPVDFSESQVDAVNREILKAIADAGPSGLTPEETEHTVEAVPALDAFYARANKLRKQFGAWDACDPTAQALLNLVAAQNSLAAAIDNSANYDDDSGLLPALTARRLAADDLMRALAVCPNAYQDPRHQ